MITFFIVSLFLVLIFSCAGLTFIFRCMMFDVNSTRSYSSNDGNTQKVIQMKFVVLVYTISLIAAFNSTIVH